MMCRTCGDLKKKVMRTTDYGVVVLRYRVCDVCCRSFMTAEEEYGAMESIIDVSRLRAASKQEKTSILARNTKIDEAYEVRV